MKTSFVILILTLFFTNLKLQSQMQTMIFTGGGIQGYSENMEYIRPFIELGIIRQYSREIHHARPNLSLTSKFVLSENPFAGLNVGGWIERPVIFGFHTIMYTNMKHLSIKIKPEIGWCYKNQIRITFGYNIPIYNHEHFLQTKTLGGEITGSYAFKIKNIK